MEGENRDNRPLSVIYAEVGQAWAHAHAHAEILEDTKSAFLSQRITQLYADLPVNRAEALVKASDEWEKRIHDTVKARLDANLLKVKLDSIRMAHSEWQSEAANERVQARL